MADGAEQDGVAGLQQIDGAGGHHAAPAEEVVRAPVEILKHEAEIVFRANGSRGRAWLAGTTSVPTPSPAITAIVKVFIRWDYFGMGGRRNSPAETKLRSLLTEKSLDSPTFLESSAVALRTDSRTVAVFAVRQIGVQMDVFARTMADMTFPLIQNAFTDAIGTPLHFLHYSPRR